MAFGSDSDESERFGTAYTKLSDRYLSHAIELVTVVIVTFTVMDGIPNLPDGIRKRFRMDLEALPNDLESF